MVARVTDRYYVDEESENFGMSPTCNRNSLRSSTGYASARLHAVIVMATSFIRLSTMADGYSFFP